MKAIQVSFDEALLSELDATEEVRRLGRSAVLRRAVSEYLLRSHQRGITERYEHSYRAIAVSAPSLTVGRKRASGRTSEPRRDLALHV